MTHALLTSVLTLTGQHYDWQQAPPPPSTLTSTSPPRPPVDVDVSHLPLAPFSPSLMPPPVWPPLQSGSGSGVSAIDLALHRMLDYRYEQATVRRPAVDQHGTTSSQAQPHYWHPSPSTSYGEVQRGLHGADGLFRALLDMQTPQPVPFSSFSLPSGL